MSAKLALDALKVLRERHQIDEPHHEHLCDYCKQADAAISALEAVQVENRCPHCDGTGDVHRADGEWIGSCTCPAGAVQVEPIAWNDWPDYHPQAMGCGLEDRGITDRYEAMQYGWDQAIEHVAERGPFYTTPQEPAVNAELREALKRIVDWNSRPLDSGKDAGRGVTKIHLEQARAAIAKATS